MMPRRNQHRDWLADGLRRRVTEDLLGPLVPTGDAAFERLAHDCIFSRIYDGSQPVCVHLGALKLAALSRFSFTPGWYRLIGFVGHRHTYQLEPDGKLDG